MIDIKPVNNAKSGEMRSFPAGRKRLLIGADSNNCHACLCAICG